MVILAARALVEVSELADKILPACGYAGKIGPDWDEYA
jgi:hypothetical protein